jgi:Protein of unknown function (DUF2783)
MTLIRTPQIPDPDDFFAELVNAQRDLSDQDAQKMLAKLVLVLANHIGERSVLSEAIQLAASSPRNMPAPGGTPLQ